jgi:transposase
VQALLRGTGKSEAARVFGVSLSSVKRYARTAREGRPLTPKKTTGKRPKIGKSARRLHSPNGEVSSRTLQAYW